MPRDGMKNGFILTGTLMLLLVCCFVSASFLFVSNQSFPTVEHWERYDQTLLAAQSATEQLKSRLHRDFQTFHRSNNRWSDLDWFVSNASSYTFSNRPLQELLHSDFAYTSSVSATVSATAPVGSGTERTADVTITLSATSGRITRTIEETVRFSMQRFDVFDYAYFINNRGWFYNVNMAVNGDIRSNRDIELKSRNLIINGDSYAGQQNWKTYNYQMWSWNSYKGDSKHNSFRPSYLEDPTKKPNQTKVLFEYGFDGSSELFNGAPQLYVPSIGNLSDYEEYAIDKNGTIKKGSVTVVSNIFTGTGPSGSATAPDKGCLVLIGTQSDPIQINGPVVIENDLIIKGYFTGNGTIYAGRNVHIIGDLIAVAPPSWNHPDKVTDFNSKTVPQNKNKDFIGLCARGSIVIGNYTSSSFNNITPYLVPKFVGESEVSPLDADLGYVSKTVDGVSYFDGDYTATFGEKCGSNAGTTAARKFYESSLSDAEFKKNISADWVSRIDAVIYNNHLTAGLLDGAVINGSIVCKDEALLLSGGRTYINWDARLGLDDFNPFLPMDIDPVETIRWREKNESL